ncbi:putative Glycosyltransferase family 2 protein [Vibrio chagasii]|nr:putative Glycosyltransferase family 2 protein [Vibrio chagasii]CAH7325012.1 putative Glycosyltransferase family 2 protein [Vibrio chagasii]CAH7364010.1 putative Glycosyltransferase family 2 protein [Vibrio chagasii]CAH7412283.1 putative Glycosyltransferase family 2 protein [Vibrio chagasii]CAH7476002.1 putative Glycosyltransferase family 2 protein [Vibrio chagasii]
MNEKKQRKSTLDKLVSVVMTTFNDSSSCIPTVRSVLNQTYENLELVVIDDCSDDFNVLKENLESLKDPRIRLIGLEKNSKAPFARNTGVKESIGEIICFLDSDDIWLDSKIEKQLSCVEEKTIVGCKIQAVYSNKVDVALPVKSEYDESKSIHSNLFGQNEHNLVLQTSSLMMMKTDFPMLSFDEKLNRHQDFQFVLDAGRSGFTIKFIDEFLVKYIKKVDSNVLNKGWSISSSQVFLQYYGSTFSAIEKENFIITQLLGPSLKHRLFFQWIKLCRDFDCLNFRFFTKSAIYVLNRVFK